MTQLKTKSGKELFDAEVLVTGVTLHKEDGVVVAKLDGETVGTVVSGTVVFAGKEVKISALVGEIDPTTLIGKDPTTLTQEELIALTTYLQQLAAGAAPAPKKEEKAKAKPASKTAPAVEEDEEDEEEGFELPEGLDTYEAIASLGVKELWAKIGKHVAAEAGIKARTPKDEMLEALAEFFGLEADEEEEEVKPAKTKSKAKAPVVEDEEDDEEFEDEDEEEFDEDEDDIDEDEDDIDEDEEDEDDIDEEDEDDIDDEDEEEFDEDEEEFEDDEDEDEDDDEVTEEDVDALFETGNKAAIVMFCKEHGITLPKKKMSAATIKQIIKDELFGDDE